MHFAIITDIMYASLPRKLKITKEARSSAGTISVHTFLTSAPSIQLILILKGDGVAPSRFPGLRGKSLDIIGGIKVGKEFTSMKGEIIGLEGALPASLLLWYHGMNLSPPGEDDTENWNFIGDC